MVYYCHRNRPQNTTHAQEACPMRTPRLPTICLSGLILLALGIGLFGTTGFIYAADRTVVGELWSADG